MGIYRNVHLTFWDDTKIVEDFTPEDKYFFLYLLTNPHTNLCGCYEISLKQMERETGYSKDTIKRLIERMENVHKVICFDNPSKELLIMNWHKYNWSKSAKTLAGIENALENVKTQSFRDYLEYIVEHLRNDSSCKEHMRPLQSSDADLESKPKKESYKEMFERLSREYNISDYLLESVNDWIAYKKERRFTYKESGLKTLLSQIEKNSRKYGDEAVSTAISESIASGYQGIVFDKIGRYANRNQQDNNNNFGRGGIDWDNV